MPAPGGGGGGGGPFPSAVWGIHKGHAGLGMAVWEQGAPIQLPEGVRVSDLPGVGQGVCEGVPEFLIEFFDHWPTAINRRSAHKVSAGLGDELEKKLGWLAKPCILKCTLMMTHSLKGIHTSPCACCWHFFCELSDVQKTFFPPLVGKKNFSPFEKSWCGRIRA